ncbi:FtsK/SpoIIIE domain-containing protein [Oscillospiraceae bacterium MB08-C2-2]|nr:FtsK/SpoIIIE domain-containing protein [Oscillospiraceae bacterium MB08-C2-2]
MNYMKRANRLANKIRKHYRHHGADITVTAVQVIYDLQRYVFTIRLAPGTRVQTILDRANDVQVAMGLPFFHPFKEGIFIRIALSEHKVSENRLLKILRSPIFTNSNMMLSLALGYDLRGNMVVVDLAAMPHLLVAGPTGTGKSVALQCIIVSIIVACPVSDVNLLLFDIGANSLSLFNDIPNLSHPVIKDIETGIRVFDQVVDEMEQRLSLDENELHNKPFLVCIIDEFLSMISHVDDKQAAKKLVTAVNHLLRRGRKAKISMILATHDPTLKNAKVDLSEIICRIAFQCANHHNSSTALGFAGAEKLPGEGAMLFKSQKGVQSLQGAYVAPEEIKQILAVPPVGYDETNKFVISTAEKVSDEAIKNIVFYDKPVEKDTKELADVLLWALGRDSISAHQIQKQFRMGNRAAAIVDELFRLNIISEKFANQPRRVIPHKVEDLSDEAKRILFKYGVSMDTIATECGKQQRPNCSQLEGGDFCE